MGGERNAAAARVRDAAVAARNGAVEPIGDASESARGRPGDSRSSRGAGPDSSPKGFRQMGHVICASPSKRVAHHVLRQASWKACAPVQKSRLTVRVLLDGVDGSEFHTGAHRAI